MDISGDIAYNREVGRGKRYGGAAWLLTLNVTEDLRASNVLIWLFRRKIASHGSLAAPPGRPSGPAAATHPWYFHNLELTPFMMTPLEVASGQVRIRQR